jgi:SPX domain protein involved in polyphosphate accumulation
MAIEVFDRYEKKFLLTKEKYEIVKEKLEGKMVADKHSKNGGYSICNVYYDTEHDDLIARSVEKPVYKEKLRLRSYGVPKLSDDVFLEIKKKFDGKVTKRRITLPLEEALDFLNNGKKPKHKVNEQIYKELCYFTRVEYELLPKLYLSYDREAFFGKDDPDFRITFDNNIRSRRENVALQAGNYGRQLLGEDIHLMEIKVSNAVPLWLARFFSENEIYSQSFSKYGTVYKNEHVNNLGLEGEIICLNQYLAQAPQQGFRFQQHSFVS